MPNLKGKVAIITGGSSGIGKATALLFGKSGARLTITGRDADKLEKVKSEIVTSAGLSSVDDVVTVVADMTVEKDLENIISATVKHFNQIDVLVNNAGHVTFESVESLHLETVDDMYRVHVRAVVYLTKLALPYLQQTRGNIVNVSSINGIRPRRNISTQAIAKAAQDHFTRCSALELASKGIRVNGVNPGTIATDIGRSACANEEEWQNYLEEAKSKHPLGRCGLPEEVANAIAFLASEEASFITATNLSVDGGAAAAES